MIECISILSGQLLVFVHFHFKCMKISLRWLDICWGCVIHQQSMNTRSACICFYFCRTCYVVVWHCTGKCRLIWKVCTVLWCNDNINLTNTKADYDGVESLKADGNKWTSVSYLEKWKHIRKIRITIICFEKYVYYVYFVIWWDVGLVLKGIVQHFEFRTSVNHWPSQKK